jgi:hypothetical protein
LAMAKWLQAIVFDQPWIAWRIRIFDSGTRFKSG